MNVSIIIPTYNKMNWLSLTLQSLLEQNYNKNYYSR